MENIGLIVGLLKFCVLATVAIYFMVAIGLTMIAARLRSAGAWMAWVPFLNFFLLCRLAQSSMGLALLAMVPLVGFIVLAYLGARIAKRLGTSGFVGALFGVPLLGAIVPIPLAIAGRAPALDAGQPDAKPASLGLGMVGIMLGVVAALAATFVAVGWMTRDKPVSATQAIAALPPHTAGTLTVFPIDTDKARPATPTNVVTQNFGTLAQAKASPSSVNVKQTQLPPWMSPARLPIKVESVAAADYRAAATDQPVTVAVMTLRDGESLTQAPTKQELASAGRDAMASGIEVKSASGDTYRGYRVKSDDAAYYALQRNDSTTGVVISAGKGADLQMAERLALGIGNGKGLLEYEDYASSFSQLPMAPAGTYPGQVMTFTEGDINMAVQQFNKEVASNSQMQDPAIADLINQARLILPSRLSIAEFKGAAQPQGAFAAVAGYSSSRSAWVAMQTISFFVSNAASLIRQVARSSGSEADAREAIAALPVVKSITIGDASGFTGTSQGITAIVLRRGGTISVLVGEAKAVDVNAWAARYAGAPSGN